jgi:uncharacterized pyridoxamine 5'-phosphate oxidase family protein
MSEIFDYLEKAGVYYIATVDSDGKPQVRPFGSKSLLDDKLYIMCTPPKPVYDQLLETKYVQIATMAPEQGWIRISAKAELVESPELRDKIFDATPGIKERGGYENMAIFALVEGEAKIFEGFGGTEPKTYTF